MSSCRPTTASQRLAPEKDGGRIEGAMRDMQAGRSTIARTRKRSSSPRRASRPAGQSTQMIVGADAANDGDIITRASALYDRFRLAPRLLFGLLADPGRERGPAA